eukprot:gene9373-biopygen19725
MNIPFVNNQQHCWPGGSFSKHPVLHPTRVWFLEASRAARARRAPGTRPLPFLPPRGKGEQDTGAGVAGACPVPPSGLRGAGAGARRDGCARPPRAGGVRQRCPPPCRRVRELQTHGHLPATNLLERYVNSDSSFVTQYSAGSRRHPRSFG